LYDILNGRTAVFIIIHFIPFPGHIAEDVPQILINREPLRHMTFDVELLGDCDVIVTELCKRLGGKWTSLLEGSEVPPVNTSLYSGLMDNTDTSSTNVVFDKTDDKENITLETHVCVVLIIKDLL
jgi:NAD-dependent deacetylase sirtuin 1